MKIRKNKLIRPGLQLRITATFVAVTLFGTLLQLLVFSNVLSGLAAELPQDPAFLVNELPSALSYLALLSMGIALPLTVAVGVLSTFRVAGPLHRFTLFLQSVERGENPGDCELRKGDELQELCELLNRVTKPLRTGSRDRSAA